MIFQIFKALREEHQSQCEHIIRYGGMKSFHSFSDKEVFLIYMWLFASHRICVVGQSTTSCSREWGGWSDKVLPTDEKKAECLFHTN